MEAVLTSKNSIDLAPFFNFGISASKPKKKVVVSFEADQESITGAKQLLAVVKRDAKNISLSNYSWDQIKLMNKASSYYLKEIESLHQEINRIICGHDGDEIKKDSSMTTFMQVIDDLTDVFDYVADYTQLIIDTDKSKKMIDKKPVYIEVY